MPTTTRRGRRPSYDPLHTRATELSDILWEKAQNIADVLAPDVPADQEPLPEEDQWLLLETVAMNLSPMAWDRPDAILDLVRLRKQFLPRVDNTALEIVAKQKARLHKMLPDPSITPENPEFADRMRRLKEA